MTDRQILDKVLEMAEADNRVTFLNIELVPDDLVDMVWWANANTTEHFFGKCFEPSMN